MEPDLLTIPETKKSNIRFDMPTKMSKLEPVFTLDFKIENSPSVTINLNAEQETKITNSNLSFTFEFDENGICHVSQKYPNEYFIDGELALVHNISHSKNDNYCKMSVNYGKGKNEIFYIKGTFNLNDYKSELV